MKTVKRYIHIGITSVLIMSTLPAYEGAHFDVPLTEPVAPADANVQQAHRLSKRTKIGIIAIGCLALCTGGILFWKSRNNSPTQTRPVPPPTLSSQNINDQVAAANVILDGQSKERQLALLDAADALQAHTDPKQATAEKIIESNPTLKKFIAQDPDFEPRAVEFLNRWLNLSPEQREQLADRKDKGESKQTNNDTSHTTPKKKRSSLVNRSQTSPLTPNSPLSTELSTNGTTRDFEQPQQAEQEPQETPEETDQQPTNSTPGTTSPQPPNAVQPPGKGENRRVSVPSIPTKTPAPKQFTRREADHKKFFLRSKSAKAAMNQYDVTEKFINFVAGYETTKKKRKWYESELWTKSKYLLTPKTGSGKENSDTFVKLINGLIASKDDTLLTGTLAAREDIEKIADKIKDSNLKTRFTTAFP